MKNVCFVLYLLYKYVSIQVIIDKNKEIFIRFKGFLFELHVISMCIMVYFAMLVGCTVVLNQISV